MQIVPNRRKDRILIRVRPEEFSTDIQNRLDTLDARLCQPLPSFRRAHNMLDRINRIAACNRGREPFLVSIPVPAPKTKAMHVRTVRGKLKGLAGTIKWVKGEAN